MPRVRRHRLTLLNRHPLLNNPVTHVQGLTRLGRGTPNPSLGIYLSQTHFKFCSLFSIYIYSNPFILLGCNTRLHGVPSAWVFVSGMLAEAQAKSFVPQHPLIFRDRVPSSLFLRPKLPPVSETRVSPRIEVRVPPVLTEARAASCPRPTCLRFSRSLYLRLGFSYLQLKRA